MNLPVRLLVLLAVAPLCHAAEVDPAGKALADTVCAACHGANGASVSDNIPNLASQRPAYIEAQLKAFRDGARKSLIMYGIASQLGPADIAHVAAYYGAQPGASPGNKSSFLPNLANSHVPFPEGYEKTFTRYHAMNVAAANQVHFFYANPVAVQAAKEGKPLPDGSVLVNVTWSGKLDDSHTPVIKDGLLEPDKLISYGVMARDTGWGKDFPDMLRNEDWNYAVFTADKQHRPGVNQAECLACHKPHAPESYLFTLKMLKEAK